MDKKPISILTVMCLTILALMLFSCGGGQSSDANKTKDTTAIKSETEIKSELQKKVDEFVLVQLKTDLSVLTEKEKQMLPILFEAAKLMEDIYWTQAYTGKKDELLASLTDEAAKKFVLINYGPWERLNDNKPFIEGVGAKPSGANFYPADMDTNEFNALKDPAKLSLYTLIRRNEKGELTVVPYHEAYKEQVTKAADLLKQAAALAEDAGLKNYLELRAEALLTDKYQPSDMAWMDMKTNTIDFVIGPIENYEDHLYSYKAAHEAFILVKDKEWSKKIDRFAALLPKLQAGLPVDAKYKKEVPGSNSDLGVYDVIFYAGDCNAGSKTIAINLPNDKEVHVKKGSRKLQLKNAMQAKFDRILVPISNLLIDEGQRKHITFDAFFENTMFHEVAHGLGIKKTLKGNDVDKAMRNFSTSLEEGKADILGLYMVTQLAEMGEFPDKDLMDNYVTFLSGIFRSVRFGAASSHGKANMVRFNYFQETEAFTRNEATGTYKVNFDKMKRAMTDLGAEILMIQGDGNFEAAKTMIETKGVIGKMLQADLDRIGEQGIPRDIVYDQGLKTLGL